MHGDATVKTKAKLMANAVFPPLISYFYLLEKKIQKIAIFSQAENSIIFTRGVLVRLDKEPN
jgi:hypothetical protein